jgi:D-cysteine desulfhydrase family pyridoxal phosphate-dependent enzyme
VTEAALHPLIDALPRFRLAALPTPVEHLPMLSAETGVNLWTKRDDLTGFALGGNKARKLEFLVGDALAHGADCVITTGGSQSNHARITAAAAGKAGLECFLVLDTGRHPSGGNLFLDNLFGAHIELLDSADPRVAVEAMRSLSDKLESQGRKPYSIPRGGSVPAGAVGYAAMIFELAQQFPEIGAPVDYLYVATGSCGTHSGIMAGIALAAIDLPVRGISVSHPERTQVERVTTLTNDLLNWLGSSLTLGGLQVVVDAAYVGEGYGVPTAGVWEAIRRLSRSEAILLDPVYTGKAMAGLLDHIDRDVVPPGSTVVFVHTGGSPALFAYADEMEQSGCLA